MKKRKSNKYIGKKKSMLGATIKQILTKNFS